MRVPISRQAMSVLQDTTATPRGARGIWKKFPDFETLRKLAIEAVNARTKVSAEVATKPRREIESLALGFKRRIPEPPPTPKLPPEEIPLEKLNKDFVNRKFAHLSDAQRAALQARMFSKEHVESSWDAEDSDYEGTKATIAIVTSGTPIAIRPKKVEEDVGPPCVFPEPPPPPASWDQDMGRIVDRLFPYLPPEDRAYVRDQLFVPDRGQIKQAAAERLSPDMTPEDRAYFEATLLSSEPGYVDKIGTEPTPPPNSGTQHRAWDPAEDTDRENVEMLVNYAKTEPGHRPLIRPQPLPKSDPPSET